MLKKMKDLIFKEEGQALTEYGLIIGLIAVVVIGLVVTLGKEIKTVFNDIVYYLQNPTADSPTTPTS